METVIWISQVCWRPCSAMAGATRLARSKAELATQASMAWVEDFDERQIKGIGTLEVAAAVGLIVPAAVEVVPVLTAIAASGVVLLMLGAGATHLRRGELHMLPVNLVLAGIERFGPNSL
jgi:DoxX-like family